MNDRWQGRNDRDMTPRRGTIVVGMLLVLLGIYFLASEQLRSTSVATGWPIFVIAPGLFLLVVGLAIPHEAPWRRDPGRDHHGRRPGLTRPGGHDTYASWVYAWALVAPGVGRRHPALYGLLTVAGISWTRGCGPRPLVSRCSWASGSSSRKSSGSREDQNGVLRDALPWMAVASGA